MKKVVVLIMLIILGMFIVHAQEANRARSDGGSKCNGYDKTVSGDTIYKYKCLSNGKAEACTISSGEKGNEFNIPNNHELNKICATTTTTTTTTSIIQGSGRCKIGQRCNEIDETWFNYVGLWLTNSEFKYKVWNNKVIPSMWSEWDDVYSKPPPPLRASSNRGVSVADLKVSGKGTCLDKVIKTTHSEVVSDLVAVEFQGKKLKFNKVVEPLIEKIDWEISEKVQVKDGASEQVYNFYQSSTGTFNWRCVNNPSIPIQDSITCRDSKGRYSRSLHSYGIAIDINPVENPFVSSSSTNGGDIPSEVIQIFKDNDFSWGGDWKSGKDLMHFEWDGNKGDFNGDGKIEESCP
jgi:hypothetical protein